MASSSHFANISDPVLNLVQQFAPTLHEHAPNVIGPFASGHFCDTDSSADHRWPPSCIPRVSGAMTTESCARALLDNGLVSDVPAELLNGLHTLISIDTIV